MVTTLSKTLSLLSHGAAGAVQNGRQLDDIALYLNTPRPIEQALIDKMAEIDELGGGVVLLIGNAGDGKSHLISRLKALGKLSSFESYNDATASCSPELTAVDTLKLALSDFSDKTIDTTHRKLLLAINLGKLNAFVEDEEVKQKYSLFVSLANDVFLNQPSEVVKGHHIRYVTFSNQQIFEILPEEKQDYPVSSVFLETLLNKIVEPNSENPFYLAYQKSLKEISGFDPTIINYELLQLCSVRKTIISLIIEAVVRFKLLVTPRDFLDFIYSIVVFKESEKYVEMKHFFDSLLPTRLFSSGSNKIQKALALLDPIKCSSVEHDKMLAILYTSRTVLEQYIVFEETNSAISTIIDRVNFFYLDHGLHSDIITKLLFRLHHLQDYHSESETYKRFINLIASFNNKKKHSSVINDLDSLVLKCIPRHFGSYYDEENLVPLDIQGSKYRLFSSITMDIQDTPSTFEASKPSEFFLSINLAWEIEGKDHVCHLRFDYVLYEYLCSLADGRLSISFESERNLEFSRFVRELIDFSNANRSIVILTTDKQRKTLRTKVHDKISLS